MKNKLLGLIKKSMLSKDRERLNVLRLIKTEFMQFETAKDAKILDNDAEMKILNKMVKQRRDSISEFTKANRMDLVEKEIIEMGIIQEFLPTEPTEEEITIYVDELLSTMENKNMGIVIKSVKEKYTNADGKLVAKIVKSKLI